MTQKISALQTDFAATHIKFQITRLVNVLKSVEEKTSSEKDYVINNLQEVETNLKSIRKIYEGL